MNRAARMAAERTEWSDGAAAPILAAIFGGNPEMSPPPLYPAWMGLGLCAETDPEIFFPEKGGSTREAKAVCRRCPVRGECLEYALERGERFGIWGGLPERARRALGDERGAAA